MPPVGRVCVVAQSLPYSSHMARNAPRSSSMSDHTRRLTRLFLFVLCFVTPAASNSCNFPASPAGKPSSSELERREAERSRTLKNARDCAADDIVFFGEVIRTIIDRLPTLSFEPQRVSLPHGSGLVATVDLFLSGGVERRALEIGQTASVAAEGDRDLPGPAVACYFTIERTAVGYRISDGEYLCHDGACGLLRLHKLDIEIDADSLPIVVATGACDVEIRQDPDQPVVNAISGSVTFDGAGAGTASISYGGQDPIVDVEFTLPD